MARAAKIYQDFVITLKGVDGGRYRVEASGPTGEATTVFTLPFDEKDIELFLLKVGHPRRMTTRGRVPEPVQPTVAFGNQLFNALINGEVRDLFVSARHDAARGNYGLRLQLRLSHVPELASLPWEYLYDGRDFLALSDLTPVVRYLDLRDPPRPMKVSPPLRILVTISAPHDQPRLDVEAEQAKIEGALASLIDGGMVQLDVTPDATLPTLRRAMRRASSLGCPYHVWHYIGHGMFDERQDTSLLAFCDRTNMSYPVGGFQLGTLFSSFPQIRLVLLNACEGARQDPQDPFSGVAAALVERGVPAVIGMQFEISDEAASTLAEEFYHALADGLPVDAALSEARQAVFFLPNWIEWATPVLFMRSPDGQIFDVTAAPQPLERPVESVAEAAKPPREREYKEREHEKLASLYSEALDAFFAEQWAKAIEILSEIVAQDPHYKDVAAKLEEARQRKTLADLYAEARRLHQARKQREAADLLARIEALDPAYPDPEGLSDSLKRERTLAPMYNRGLEHMNAGEWLEALRQFEEIDRLAAGYRQVEVLLARLRREFDLRSISSPIHLELVRVPAGEFLMGSDRRKDEYAFPNEQPQHRVYVAEFYIGKYPVTNSQYAAFARAAGRKEAGQRGQDTHPAVNVSWHDAVAFCEWLSRETGQPFRLPTEAEWEKAARGTDGRTYPWGDDWDTRKCNSLEFGACSTTPVGHFSPAGDSPCGAADMAGNVWEWCQSLAWPYPYRADDGREDLKAEGSRVQRGGASCFSLSVARCAFRTPEIKSIPPFTDSGFRCVLAPALQGSDS